MYNLTKVLDFLNSLIKKRKRQSKRTSRQVDISDAYPRNGKAYPTLTPGPLLFSGNSLKQQRGESDLAYHLRLENEVEELSQLTGVITQMLEVHNHLIESLEKVIPSADNAHGQECLVGDIIMEFGDRVLKPYITYAIVTLAGVKKPSPHLGLSEQESAEFVSRVVQKFIGERYNDLPEFDQPKNPMQAPSQSEWECFLRRPIQRLEEYEATLSKIISVSCFNDSSNQDNRKVRIAKIKLTAVSKSIQDRLNVIKPFSRDEITGGTDYY